jgi:pSer/pThr/pTyr-binding forkhead associated (FHA) protein
MFVLEIDFHDGVSPPEVIFVRRPHAIIGTSDFAHVVIEGASSSFYELRVTRGVGQEFRCQPISKHEANQPVPAFLDGVYSAEAELDLGNVTTHLTAIDLDLQFLPGESPDAAGLRVLRRALTSPTPVFPAVAVLGPIPIFISFPIGEPLLVGRSRKCGLRLDSSEISGEHARIGYNEGAFWVEDLGSSNGTFVQGMRISGRRVLADDETITLGSEFTLAGVKNQQDVITLNQRMVNAPSRAAIKESYPCLVTKSELIRPSRYLLSPGVRVSIGRDPANDIWVGAAHISREHAIITLNNAGKIEVTDKSSNGIWLKGERVLQGKPIELDEALSVLNLGGKISLAICYSKEDEQKYSSSEEIAVDTQAADKKHTPLKAKGVFDTSHMEVSRDSYEGSSNGVFTRLAERSGNRLGLSSAKRKSISNEEIDKVRDSSNSSEQALINDDDSLVYEPQMSKLGRAIVIFSVFGLVVIIGLFIYTLMVV